MGQKSKNVNILDFSMSTTTFQICEFVPLGVLKPNMTVARVVAVPFPLIWKNDENPNHVSVTQRTFISEILREISHAIGIYFVVSELVPRRGDIMNSKPRSQNEILAPLSDFENFRQAAPSFSWGSTPTGGTHNVRKTKARFFAGSQVTWTSLEVYKASTTVLGFGHVYI